MALVSSTIRQQWLCIWTVNRRIFYLFIFRWIVRALLIISIQFECQNPPQQQWLYHFWMNLVNMDLLKHCCMKYSFFHFISFSRNHLRFRLKQEISKLKSIRTKNSFRARICYAMVLFLFTWNNEFNLQLKAVVYLGKMYKTSQQRESRIVSILLLKMAPMFTSGNSKKKKKTDKNNERFLFCIQQ